MYPLSIIDSLVNLPQKSELRHEHATLACLQVIRLVKRAADEQSYVVVVCFNKVLLKILA